MAPVMNTSLEVGEYLLNHGTHHADTKNQSSGSDIGENPNRFLGPSNGIESATNSEVVTESSVDASLPLPDADQIPVSMQFAVVLPKVKRKPRENDDAQGLSLFAATLIVIFACVAAMLGGLLAAFTTAEPSLGNTLSKVEAWNAEPLAGAIPAKDVSDATRTTRSIETNTAATGEFFVAVDAVTPDVDIVWEIERDALGVPLIESDQWRATEERITASMGIEYYRPVPESMRREHLESLPGESSSGFADEVELQINDQRMNEHVRSLLGLATKRADSIPPSQDANPELTFASFPVEPVTSGLTWSSIVTSLQVPQMASVWSESPNLWVVQDSSGFGTIAVLPADQRAIVSIEAPAVVEIVAPKITLGFAEFHQIQTRDRKGVELQFTIAVDRYLGDQLEIGAYFFDDNGVALKDRDAKYVSERGNVYTKQIVAVESSRYDNNAFTLFLPYLQFDALPGGTHQLQAQIFVWAGPPFQERLAFGARQEFDLTLYKFLARSR